MTSVSPSSVFDVAEWQSMTSAPHTGEAILIMDAKGMVFLGAWKLWWHDAQRKDVSAWWAVFSKPYFVPTQIEIVNPQMWQPVPGRDK